jgi:sialic acid synthase SpsE
MTKKKSVTKSTKSTKSTKGARSAKSAKSTKKRKRQSSERGAATPRSAPVVEIRRRGVQHTIRLGDRTAGTGLPTIVVAEIGVNHDGSSDRAMQLLKLAAECGADAVKFQVFRADALVNPACGFAEYQSSRCDDADAATMLKRYELDFEALRELVWAANDMNLLPLATPFSVEDVDTIAALGIPAIKIASPDLVNRPLLERAVETGKPLLVSTGAANAQEVESTTSWLRSHGASFALIHCISSYPTPPSSAQLCWINELSRLGVPVGYSDHTTETSTGGLAVAAGACIVEKHLTYDRDAAGPDHAASADREQLEEYVRQVRVADLMRGRPGKHVLAIEQDVRRVSRQSLVLRRDLRAGETIRETDLTIQRPGTGIPAAELTDAVGRRAREPLKAGTLLRWDMLDRAA